MKSSFIKQSIGINPLLTARDWLLLFGLIGAAGLSWILVPEGGATAFARGAFVGGICGSVPGLIGCLPVRGSSAADGALQVTAPYSFYSRLKRLQS